MPDIQSVVMCSRFTADVYQSDNERKREDMDF